ncbi:MAG: hypothetical protein IJA10_04275 [Lachnospiraceae bacterium]|nr:hypothetical protein [Lachnospiraceae bacterium]
MKHHLIKNSLIRYCLYGFLFVSILGTLAHFFYDWSGQNPIVGFFSPVNESTWEHMKLLFFPMLLYYVLTYQKLEKAYPLSPSTYPLSILVGTWLIPVLFYSYSGILGFHVAFLDILTFYVSVFLAFLYFYFLTRDYPAPSESEAYYQKHPKRNAWLMKLKPFFSFLVFLHLLLFILFTYRPPELGIFKEP